MSYFKDNYKNLSYPISESISTSTGFRNAQLGALHSISSHFTVHDKEPAIVVMPTGSGKTAVLFASAYALRAERVLVLTTSKLVRNQIAEGFQSLEVLIGSGALPANIKKPKVLEAKELLDTQGKWEKLSEYDVVVAAPNALPINKWGIDPPLELFDLLLIDEAHHSPAHTWNSIIRYFKKARKILFTATPFRMDKKEIKGRFIYDYPVSKAFVDGIFGNVNFIPVQTSSSVNADINIAKATDKEFKADRAGGFKHYILVRTDTKLHAKELIKIYDDNTGLKLKLLDSTLTAAQVRKILDQLKSGSLDGVICVNMLGEGFDFPNLKIAAIHRPHQSLAITLQFIGRFARTNATDIGPAKFLAIPNEINFLKLELYAEGAIWKDIIQEISEKTIQNEIEVRKTLNSFEDQPVDFEDDRDISLYSIKPGYHVKIYDVTDSVDITKQISIPDNSIDKHFVSAELSVAVYLTKEVSKPKWLTTDELLNVNFNLFIIFHDKQENLLYINSTRKTIDTYRQIASQYLSETPKQLPIEYVHKVIGDIESPEVFHLGLRNKNTMNNAESYLTKAGSHVQNSIKSNEISLYEGGHLFLRGKEDGSYKTIGYSSSSKVWSNYAGRITEFIEWCTLLSKKINNPNDVKTNTDLDHISRRKVVAKLPLNPIFAVWRAVCYKNNFQYHFNNRSNTYEGTLIDLDISITNSDAQIISFEIYNESFQEEYTFDLDNFYISKRKADPFLFVVDPETGETIELGDFLHSYPLIFYFQDFSSLILNEISNKIARENTKLSPDKIDTFDWSDTDIDCEFSGNAIGRHNVHSKLEQALLSLSPDILIYDHGSGEMADYIAIRELPEFIIVEFYHCKGAGGKTTGNRVGDLYEVCGQSVKSCLWTNSSALREKIKMRLKRENPSTFIAGDINLLNKILGENKIIHFKIIGVQPGIAKDKIDPKLQELLSAAESYIEQGDGLKFRLITS